MPYFVKGLRGIAPLLVLTLSLAASAADLLPHTAAYKERLGSIRIQPPNGGGEPIRMQYTLYMPDGPGPFPLVVVNHGRSRNPRTQSRDRPWVLADLMVMRGYAVVAPMRRGFAGSGGRYTRNGCVEHRRIDKTGPGYEQALGTSEEVIDLHAFLNEIVRLREIDRTRILMVSQSGGFTSTLGYMTMPRPGVLGYINFVGGGFTYCGGRDDLVMARAGGRQLGAQVKRPGLWIYANQDSYVSAASYRVMFDSFVAAGGKATWALLDPPIEEGHYMLGRPAAVATWWPPVEAFLKELGLPTEERR